MFSQALNIFISFFIFKAFLVKIMYTFKAVFGKLINM